MSEQAGSIQEGREARPQSGGDSSQDRQEEARHRHTRRGERYGAKQHNVLYYLFTAQFLELFWCRFVSCCAQFCILAYAPFWLDACVHNGPYVLNSVRLSSLFCHRVCVSFSLETCLFAWCFLCFLHSDSFALLLFLFLVEYSHTSDIRHIALAMYSLIVYQCMARVYANYVMFCIVSQHVLQCATLLLHIQKGLICLFVSRVCASYSHSYPYLLFSEYSIELQAAYCNLGNLYLDWADTHGIPDQERASRLWKVCVCA